MGGCATAPTKSDQEAVSGLVGQTFSPFFDFAMLRYGRIDLIYCIASFQHKNARLPKDYAELSDFVQQSDGYLTLGRYERVDFIPLPNKALEVRCVPEGRTNEVKFTLGDVVQGH